MVAGMPFEIREENDEHMYSGICSRELDVAKVISLVLSIQDWWIFVYVIEAHQFIAQIKNIETI